MLKTTLLNYAKLLARVGLNVQKGQEVIIYAEMAQMDFLIMVVKECYLAGASKVRIEWTHQPIDKLHVLYQSEEDLAKVHSWQHKKFEEQTQLLPAKLYIDSSDPDGMVGIDIDKYAKARAKRAKLIKPYRNKMENKYQWCIASVPSLQWASKIFPYQSKTRSLETKLWKAILQSVRALEGNPIRNWEKHNLELLKRANFLNALQIDRLQYTSCNGTNFSVALLPKSRFMAGGEKTLSGIYFNPNIPTEECFTTPDKYSAEGIVYATKPLSYKGQLIEDFYLEFKAGKVIKADARVGADCLQKMLNMDEGASYLGEVALVPQSSPIQQSNLLFYNTLFDENASCHLAIGRGFTNCIDGYEDMTEEELQKYGVNDSIEHTDFMIGCDDLNIIATTRTGQRVEIFKNGEWAFCIDN